jgi:galactokinase
MGWPNYVLGVVDQLKKAGYEVPGFDLAFGGNIPIGAGMSSSAALEGGTIFGLSEIFDWDISRLDMVKKSQKAENEFVGVNCGIMDQFANIFSEEGKVFQLDCRSLDYEYYPFVRDDLKIILCDTTVRRELATSEYNVRRSQCEEGIAILNNFFDNIYSLRDATLDMLYEHKSEFDPVVYKRCSYVIEENNRVQQACDYLEKEDFHSFGQAMYQSHAGLKDKYEVSSPELDILVDIAKDIDGVLGARMMGAGFGGCTINLVEAKHTDSFTSQITEAYEKESGVKIPVYQSTIATGVGLL